MLPQQPQLAPRLSTGTAARSAVAPMAPEMRAASKLLAAPPPVPDAVALRGRVANKRRQPQLHAQDDLRSTIEWTRELLTPSTSVLDPQVAVARASAASDLSAWRERGEQACAQQIAAHQAAVADVLAGSSALTADLARLRKCARQGDCDAAVRAREHAHPDAAFQPVGPVANTRVATHAVAAPSAKSLLIL